MHAPSRHLNASAPSVADNNENAPGVILQSLLKFPTDYIFSFVGQPSRRPGCTSTAFVEEMVAAVAGACEVEVPSGGVETIERMGGKYVSVRVTCCVRAPEMVARVYDSLNGDERVRMKF
jgi:putative lipoic acid-binding regulatory protein